MFYSVDGRPISLTEFIESLFNTLEMPDLFKNEEELRAIWAVPSTRKILLKQLESAGFSTEELVSVQELIEAKNSDLFDVLEFIKYAKKPITRVKRAAVSRSVLERAIAAKQLEFVDFLASQYVETGVEVLEDSKLETLLSIKYKSAIEGVSYLGSAETARQLFLEFQKNLYRPDSEYATV
jgi:type I restriction enzyme R subunit